MSIVVKLDAFDMAEVLFIAERITAIRSVLPSTKEFVNGVSSFERNYIGAMGEVAVCRHFGIPHPHRISAGGDGGSDLLINGWNTQVKCSAYNGKDPELIFRTLEYFKANVAIKTAIETATSVRLVGCISRPTFRKIAEQKNYGYGEHFCVSDSKLEDVSILLEIQLQREAA